jgi:hypothetical protein
VLLVNQAGGGYAPGYAPPGYGYGYGGGFGGQQQQQPLYTGGYGSPAGSGPYGQALQQANAMMGGGGVQLDADPTGGYYAGAPFGGALLPPQGVHGYAPMGLGGGLGGGGNGFDNGHGDDSSYSSGQGLYGYQQVGGYPPQPGPYAQQAYAHADAVEAEQSRTHAARDERNLQQLQYRQGQQMRAAGSPHSQLPVFT